MVNNFICFKNGVLLNHAGEYCEAGNAACSIDTGI